MLTGKLPLYKESWPNNKYIEGFFCFNFIFKKKKLCLLQTLEQQRLRTSLELQRKEDFVSMEARLRVELERQYYELKAQYAHDVSPNI